MSGIVDRAREPASVAAAETLIRRFSELAEIEPEATAVIFQERIYRRGEIRDAAKALGARLDEGGVGAGGSVGWLARNSPEMMSASLGLLMVGRTLCVVNVHEPAAVVARRLREIRPAAVVGVTRDWTPEVRAAVREIGAVGIVMDLGADPSAQFVDDLSTVGPGPHRELPPGTVLELITSGTTGDPKRIQISASKFMKGIAWGTRKESAPGRPPERPTARKSPAILVAPFSHTSGVFHHLLALREARPIVLHERFQVDQWLEDVRKYRPRVANLVPAAIAMVMASEATREDLASLIVVRAGTAPLDPKLREAFEDRFSVPVLLEYGATEFFGGLTMWSLAEYEKYKATKRASVGRPKSDVQMKVVDPQTGKPLPTGEVGRLVLKSDRFGPDWVETSDLGAFDEDGFLYIHGRVDQAINRGGFKILPDVVGRALRAHPAVKDVVVLGVKDPVLGQVPIAAVELRPDAGPDALGSLQDFARENLAKYQVPVAFEVFDALPRTVSLKVALPQLKEQLADRYQF